jgi:hypothetical protein
MTAREIHNYLKIVRAGNKPFYASDFDLMGADLQKLQSSLLVTKTGEYKLVQYEVEEDEPLRTGKVLEWQLTGREPNLLFQLDVITDQIRSLLQVQQEIIDYLREQDEM